MVSSKQQGVGAQAAQGAIVFVHGYLDGPEAWGRVRENLVLPGWSLDAIRLEPMHTPQDSSAEILQQYAGQVLRYITDHVNTQAGSVVLVGHSMGAQIAELAADLLGERLSGLILVTPAPLEGYPLPPNVMEQFVLRAGGTDVVSIKKGKRGLAVALDDEALDILVSATLATNRDTALEQLRAWTGGHSAGAHPSELDVPVLLISTDDTFITEELVGRGAKRYRMASVEKIPGAGHWPQLEQHTALTQSITQFVQSLPSTVLL